MNLWIDTQALVVLSITAAVLTIVLNAAALFPRREDDGYVQPDDDLN